MKRPTRWLLGGMLLLLLAASLYLALRPVTPHVRGRPVSYWLNRVLSEDSHLAWEAFSEAGAVAVPFLTNALLRPPTLVERHYREVHQRAPNLLRNRMPSPRSVENRQLAALLALGAIDSPAAESAIPALQHLVSSGSAASLRNRALETLFHRLPSDTARLALVESQLADPGTQHTALSLLMMLTPKVDCSRLIPRMSDLIFSADIDLSRTAVAVAGAFGPRGERLLPGLLAVLEHSDPSLGSFAMHSLAKIDPSGAACLPFIPGLLRKPATKIVAAQLVAELQLPAHEILALKEQVDQTEEMVLTWLQFAWLRAAPAEALVSPDMALLAEGSHSYLTERSVQIVRDARVPKGKAFLFEVLANEATHIRFRALEGLRESGIEPEDLPQLLQALGDETEPRMVSPLLELIGSQKNNGRPALEAIRPFLQHEYRHVRESAEWAIKEITEQASAPNAARP